MTRKEAEKQYAINAYIEDMIDTYLNPELEESASYLSRLRSCSACVIVTEHFYVLKSYNTIIASYNKATGEFIDFLRYVYGYTSTSAQHIAKFRNDYARNRKSEITYRVIPYKYQEEFDNSTVEQLFG